MVRFSEKAPGITVVPVSNAACCAESTYEKGKAICGGIPVYWPWFGAHPDNASHLQLCFLRLTSWSLADIRETADCTVLAMGIRILYK